MRRRRSKLAPEQRTRKAMAVTEAVWLYVNSKRAGFETFDDALRRLLSLPAR